MKYQKLPCNRCKGDMVAQYNGRSFYYRCTECGETVNKKPAPSRRVDESPRTYLRTFNGVE